MQRVRPCAGMERIRVWYSSVLVRYGARASTARAPDVYMIDISGPDVTAFRTTACTATHMKLAQANATVECIFFDRTLSLCPLQIDDLPNSVPDLGTSTRGGNSDSATRSRSQGKDSLFIV